MPDFKAFVRQHLTSLALPSARETKIVEELAAQIEESYDALIAHGVSENDAWREVQRHIPDWKSFGDELLDGEPVIVRLAQPNHAPLAGEMKRGVMSRLGALVGTDLIRDLRSTVRLLLKSRGFTATTILTLAVCLGANVAVFTVVHSVLLRPLPVPDSHRIVGLGDVYPTITPNDILANTVPAYFDRLKALTALEDQAMFTMWFDTLQVGGKPEELRGMRATPSLFRVLKVDAALGRTFTDAEGELGADKKIILSHGFWQRLFGGDTTVIGRDLKLGWTGQNYTIVGVMPRGFSFFEVGDAGHARGQGDTIDFWIPLAFTDAQKSDEARTRYGYYHIGRLRPGATVEQVKAQADALNAANWKRFPDLGQAELHMYTSVMPLQDALTRSVSRVLYLLWGGVACVLLIGTLNIANLALTRASTRTKELATRLALGAGRLRLTRQLVIEGVLLAGIGGVAGLGVAFWMLRALASSGLARLPNAASIQMDGVVIAFTLGMSVLVGVLIGLVPATSISRVDLNQVLIEGGRGGTAGRATQFFRRGLVVAQVACSVGLLMGAGLLLVSFRNLLAVDAGFNAQRVTTATIFPPPSRYKDNAAVVALSNRILESVRALPGVQAAGLTSNIALSGGTSPMAVSATDRPPQPGEAIVVPSVATVSPGYFEAMGTPLVRGRFFAESDRENSLRVAIVDERLAARFWQAENPIGKRIQRDGEDPSTVVGVVREMRFENLTGQSDAIGAAYFPPAQAPPMGRLRWIAVKSTTESGDVIRAIRSALNTIDPELPLSDVQTMTERTERSLVAQRLAMGLASMYGGVALFLSMLGLYGVLAYLVARKTREIGIRMALGSTPRGIFRIFFTEGLLLVGLGLALGVIASFALGRALEGQVFGVRPSDPVLLGSVVVLTGVVALLACVSPAYRASNVDPLTVLTEQ
jgi:putative ABC transport system permease protein